MIPGQVSVFANEGDDSQWDSGDVALELTDLDWCRDDHGHGFVELRIPLGPKKHGYVRFRVSDLINDIVRKGRR